MHFDAAGLSIDLGGVLKLAQIKIAIEFAIDTSEQVEIESCGHSNFIVVGFQQLLGGLFQVRSKQQRISGLKNVANFRQKLYSCGAIKITNRASKKHDEEMLIALAMRRHLQQSVQVLAFKTYNTQRIDIAQLAFAHGQR